MGRGDDSQLWSHVGAIGVGTVRGNTCIVSGVLRSDDSYFQGRLDELQIYNQALSVDEIAAIAGETATCNPSNLQTDRLAGQSDSPTAGVTGDRGDVFETNPYLPLGRHGFNLSDLSGMSERGLTSSIGAIRDNPGDKPRSMRLLTRLL